MFSIAVLVSLLLVAAFTVVFRQVTVQGRMLPADLAGWFSQLSAERYRPMERLLDDGDFEFLKHQPGFTARMGRALRAERRRIFRSYLRGLSRDFSRTCRALHMLMLASPHDRPDLAAILVRQRLSFTLGVMEVECRLVMHAWGWGRVDVRRLVGALDSMRLELNHMLQPAAVTAA